jgi:hypothetical protein
MGKFVHDREDEYKPRPRRQSKVTIARKSGERNGQAKLTDEEVEKIRTANGAWGFQRRLARKYGVSPATITAIRQGKSWKPQR